MEFEFHQNIKCECEFILNLNKRTFKLIDLDSSISNFLSENMKIDEKTYENFLKEFKEEIEILQEKGRIGFEKKILIPSVGTRFFIIRAKYNKKNKLIEGVLIDDTSNMIFNEKNVQTEKLKSLGALAGGVAHEFNNNLMVILGACELLKKYNSDSKLLPFIENILMGAKSSNDLVNKLLTFSHSDRIKKEKFNLVPCVKETVSLLKHIVTNNVTVIYNCFIDKILVYGNRSLIQTAILNVCKNCMDSFDDLGVIVIKTSVIKYSTIPNNIINGHNFTEGYYVAIKISDNGRGIEEKNINKIFDPFYSTKNFNNDTGLGLSTVLGTVESHQGLVGITSKVNEGTHFTFYFKLVEDMICF